MKLLSTSFVVLFILCLLPVTALAQSIQSATTGLGFGASSATNGDDIFVGAAAIGWPRGDEPAGTVYHYTRNEEGAWGESGRIQAPDAQIGDFFGRSIYLNDSMLLIGAPGVSKVYVYEKNGNGEWVETGSVNPSNVGGKIDFGGTYARGGYRTNTIAMAGDRIVVSAYPRVELDLRSGRYATNESGGAVYVFKKEGGEWVQESVLTSDEAEGNGFGFSLVASDNRIVVSAPGTDNGKGALHAYSLHEGTWKHSMIDSGSELELGSVYGLGLALHGDNLYASAPGFDRTGTVFSFKWSEQAMGWQPAYRLTLPIVAANNRRGGLGTDIAASARALLVNGPNNSVYAYQVSPDASMWESMHILTSPNERSERAFGIGLAVSDEVAVIGSPNADYQEGIATVFENDGQLGNWKPTGMLISETNRLSSVTGDKVQCEDGKAGLFDCQKVDLLSFISLQELSPNRGAKMTDIWGWEDPDTGAEYVLQGREDGVAFVNIQDPYNPVYVGQLMKTEGSPGSNWRDVKVYNNHAFIVADGAGLHGLQIFDLTQLRDVKPEDMPVDFKETVHYDGIASSHNIVINEDTGYAYAVGNDSGGESCGGQLHMINIQDPQNPTFEGCFIHEGGRGTHDAQCVIYRGPDDRYQGKEVCLNSNGSSFILADVSDKTNPVTISQTTYPNLAYTHQGWLSEDHRYFYMNDELDELNGSVSNTRTLIWDIAELDDPVLAKEYFFDSKASDHNLYIQGNYLYASNYQAGLRILDISDPLNPVEVAKFDTVPYGEDVPGFGGSWSNYPYFKSGVIAVSSRAEGLFIVKKQEIDL